MKRAGRLYPLIMMQDNLHEAFRKAARGKRNNREVILFLNNFDSNIKNLQEQLLNHEPDIGHYRFFTVRDPKVRTICAASFPERVLHHAVMNVCEPYLDRYAIHDSYACRKGKGNRKALEKAQEFTRKYNWYLKLDIRKYFDSIDHEIMLKLLSKCFKDPELLTLFYTILETYHTEPGRGVPIGNLISQHLANFYLGSFDHWIKQAGKIKGYVRYMDDFILFSNEKQILKTELEELKQFLKNKLNLELKNNIQMNKTYLGIPFLGFRVFPNHTNLMAQTMKRFSKKYRKYEKNYCEGIWTEKELIRHMEPLKAFTDTGHSTLFRRMVIKQFGVLL